MARCFPLLSAARRLFLAVLSQPPPLVIGLLNSLFSDMDPLRLCAKARGLLMPVLRHGPEAPCCRIL